jgi:SM-20-related protein
MLDLAPFRLDRFNATPLLHTPFEHLVTPGFLEGDSLAFVRAHYPIIDKPGSFPTQSLTVSKEFQSFLDQLQGKAMTAAFSEKFGIDLSNRPTMITLRGQCRATDGKVHTDSLDKIITVLIYLNDRWDRDGGRLRLLRSARIDDYFTELPPDEGLLLAFKRADNSWHGHLPYEGPRRAIQLNWVVDDSVVTRERRRHQVSAFFKKLNPL